MTLLFPGDPAQIFITGTANGEKFNLSQAGGKIVVLTFFGSCKDETIRTMLQDLSRRKVFDSGKALCLALTCDQDDVTQKRLPEATKGFRVLYDFSRRISSSYGLGQDADSFTPMTIILDQTLRVLKTIPLDDPKEHLKDIRETISNAPKFPLPKPAISNAPVLVLPRVFEPELCESLVAYYKHLGGDESGFMRNNDRGQTISVVDHRIKRRKDLIIQDGTIRQAIKSRIQRRLIPEITRSFQFNVSRIERYIIACYNAEEGGYFTPHRDNTTKGTAHRKFAVTINLNPDDYEGGDLRFPEYDSRTYRAPQGGAVVFSCSLLHEATPVTKGTRYAVLPFLYDEAGAQIRQQNLRFISDEKLRDQIEKSIK